jgi:hypothetical protein
MERELPPTIRQGFATLFEAFRATTDPRLSPEDAAARFGMAARLYALDWYEHPPDRRPRRCLRPE